jgi:hypothetical protein
MLSTIIARWAEGALDLTSIWISSTPQAKAIPGQTLMERICSPYGTA